MRALLRERGLGSVRVGTVDDYQGQEERIIFISTVSFLNPASPMCYHMPCRVLIDSLQCQKVQVASVSTIRLLHPWSCISCEGYVSQLSPRLQDSYPHIFKGKKTRTTALQIRGVAGFFCKSGPCLLLLCTGRFWQC